MIVAIAHLKQEPTVNYTRTELLSLQSIVLRTTAIISEFEQILRDHD